MEHEMPEQAYLFDLVEQTDDVLHQLVWKEAFGFGK